MKKNFSIIDDIGKWKSYDLSFTSWHNDNKTITSIHKVDSWEDAQKIMRDYFTRYGNESLNYNKAYDKEGKSGQTVIFL